MLGYVKTMNAQAVSFFVNYDLSYKDVVSLISKKIYYLFKQSIFFINNCFEKASDFKRFYVKTL